MKKKLKEIEKVVNHCLSKNGYTTKKQIEQLYAILRLFYRFSDKDNKKVISLLSKLLCDYEKSD